MHIFASDRQRRRVLLHAVIVTVVLITLFVMSRRHLPVFTNAQEIRAYVRGFGSLAPLVLIGLQAGQVILVPIPGQVLGVVGGYLFGPVWGTLYNMLGITLGSTIAFWLARRYGRPYVETVIHEETLTTFDGFSRRNGLVGLFVLFLIPGMPDDTLCFIGGLTEIPLRKLVTIAIIGRTPAFFVTNLLGSLLATAEIRGAFVLAALLIGVSAFGYLNRSYLLGVRERE